MLVYRQTRYQLSEVELISIFISQCIFVYCRQSVILFVINIKYIVYIGIYFYQLIIKIGLASDAIWAEVTLK